MERDLMSELFQWKDRENRKPLILRGARQVGKTWLIREFAQRAYHRHVYVNFEDDEILRDVFTQDFDIERILSVVGLRMHTVIDSDTLIIFDEIQVAPRGITSLKYFFEKAPQLHVVAAGSLLGISSHYDESFPVGKVDYLNLYPLSFREFLCAVGENQLLELIEKKDWEKMIYVRDRLISLLKTYYFIGGMPEVVDSFLHRHDYDEVRRLQNNILLTYSDDMSKHAPKELVPRMRLVWNSIVGQLAKENRKFLYGLLRNGARAKDFEMAIEWLVNAGLIYKVHRCKSGELPLSAYEDTSSFKVFMLDVGLLCAMAKLPAETLVNGNEMLLTYKGAMTEQYVYQQLRSKVDFAYYWSAENSKGEIDFLVQNKGRVIPVEVKAEENLKSRSLRSFVSSYEGMHGIRLSMSDYRKQDWMTNIPLYAI